MLQPISEKKLKFPKKLTFGHLNRPSGRSVVVRDALALGGSAVRVVVVLHEHVCNAILLRHDRRSKPVDHPRNFPLNIYTRPLRCLASYSYASLFEIQVLDGEVGRGRARAGTAFLAGLSWSNVGQVTTGWGLGACILTLAASPRHDRRGYCTCMEKVTRAKGFGLVKIAQENTNQRSKILTRHFS